MTSRALHLRETTLLWAQRLRTLCEPVLVQTNARPSSEWIGSFSDEHGDRRLVDPPLLSLVLGCPASPPSQVDRLPPDVRLWWCLQQRSWDDDILAPGSACPLVPHRPDTAIEVWTEAELCALHALWSASLWLQRTDLRDRAVRAVRWHLDHTQPDNATNHAWAAHVFARVAIEHNDRDCEMYAQTLVHNCCVWDGRPDRLSAFVLMHAAMELQRELKA